MFSQKKNSNKSRSSREEKFSFSDNLLLSKKSSKTNSKKVEILTNQKSFLEILLNLMKKTQLNYLSAVPKKKNNIQIKKILTDLKDDLSSMFKEQKLAFNYLDKEHSKKKSEVQDLLFPSNECKRSENCEGVQTVITENDEKTDETEINQIKFMNFRIENEISNIDYFIIKKGYLLNYMKNFSFFREDTKEIFCENFKEQKEITEFLHDILIKMRQNFVDMVYQKTKTDAEIKELQSQIEMRKDDFEMGFENNRYINSEDIIQEESRDFTQSVSTSNNNTYFLTNKKTLNNNLTVEKNNNQKLRRGTNLSTRDVKQRVDKLGLISQSRRSSWVDINDIKKYLNLNMNINLNINLNNQYLQNTFNSSKISDDEDGVNKKKYEQIDKQFELYLNEYKKSMININKKRDSSISSFDENCEYALDIKDGENQKSIPSFCSSN